MNLLAYLGEQTSVSSDLRKAILSVLELSKMEILTTSDDLRKRLLQKRFNLDVIVVLAGTCEELGRLLGLREHLRDLRLVLIVPDSTPETLSLGHSFFPRFLCTRDDPPEHVAAVLKKMMLFTEMEETI